MTTSELVMTSTLDIVPSILCDEDNARLGCTPMHCIVITAYDVRHTVFTYCMHHAGASVDLPGKLLRTLATSYASTYD